MLIFGLALLLAIAGIAGFPCWPYSRRIGYGPSLSAGVLLLLVAVFAVSHHDDGPLTEGPTTAKDLQNVKLAATPAIMQALPERAAE